MNPQLAIIVICVLAAICFITQKAITAIRRHDQHGCPGCGECSGKSCAGCPQLETLRELKPGQH